MGSNLLFALTIYLLIFVSVVICGRFPVRINSRNDDSSFTGSGIDVTSVKEVGYAIDDYNYAAPQEDINLENYLDSADGNNADYVTDVQINQLKNVQDTLRQDQAVYTVDPRCPTFNGICSAQICTSDSDCGNQICCYNGCVHACTESEFSPLEVNWVPFGNEGADIPLQANNGDTITIPGGCKVSQKEKTSLDLFFKYGHVTKCVCMKDDVVCYVRRRDTFSVQKETED